MIHTEIHCQFNNFYRSAVFVGMNGKMEVNKHEKNSIHVEPFNIEVDSLTHSKCIQMNDIVRITRNDHIL